MENQALIQNIKQWLDLEQKIADYSKELRELRKMKKELSVDLVEVMKTNDIDCFDCKSGQLTYTKNNVKKSINKKYLNEVLNQTKPLGAPMEDEYPTLGGGVLGSDNMADVLGYGDLGRGQNKERAREMAAVDTIKKAGVSVDAVPEDVQNALTRDYSGLMKAINNKKKGEGGFRP